MAAVAIALGSTNEIRLSELHLDGDDEFIDNATVTATVRDQAGAAVNGLSAISMAAVADSDGDYAGVFDSASLVAGKTYLVDVVAIAGGVRRTFRASAIAKWED